MRSKIFYSAQYFDIQTRIKDFLNRQEDYLSSSSLNSPRAVGDAIQDILANGFAGILGEVCGTCTTDFARRAMAEKIHKRVLRFQAIKTVWQSKTDIWQMAPVDPVKEIGASQGS